MIFKLTVEIGSNTQKKSVYLLFRLYENKYQENKILKNIGVIYELPLAFLAPAVDSVFCTFAYLLAFTAEELIIKKRIREAKRKECNKKY